MKQISITPFGAPATEEQIYSFESFIKAKLPEEYIKFLKKYNGGRLEKEDTYPMIEEIDIGYQEEGIEYFFGLNVAKGNDLKEQVLIFKGRIPHNFIPIGDAPCGNLVCLAVLGENYGKVYYWDHNEEAEDGEEPSNDNVYLIANSFEEFINSLYEYKV